MDLKMGSKCVMANMEHYAYGWGGFWEVGGGGGGARKTCDLWHIFQSIPREGPLLLEIIIFCLIHSDATAVARLLLGEIDYYLLNKE